MAAEKTEFARQYDQHFFGGIEVLLEAEHRTADGRRLWVTHGDQYDGVVCGHIHKAEMREVDGILYCNDGDWVESLTALVEHDNGRLELIYWSLRETRP